MPAYVQHHQDIEIAPVICPTCMGFLPMYVREVEPHWSLARSTSSMNAPIAAPRSDRPSASRSCCGTDRTISCRWKYLR